MSAIGGIYRLDGGGVDVAALSKLADALGPLGPDGNFAAIDGPVGFIWRPFHTTPESHAECQPVRRDGLIVAFDGRIDNRTDLAAQLQLKTGDFADVDFVLASYSRWRTQFIDFMVGDYALAVWDSSARRVTLARDPFGIRGLFYHMNDSRVVWASSISALLTFPDVATELDEIYISDFLVLDADGSRSAFKHIKPVKHGHCVLICPGGLAEQRIYDITAHVTELRPQPDEEYEANFKSLFAEAVRTRLRADRPIAAGLSGGLDSSSVVCMADSLSDAMRKPVASVETISYVYDKAATSDERSFIHVVERHRKRSGLHLREDDQPAFTVWPDKNFISFPSPFFCFGGLIDALLRGMRQMGARVLLSGTCGDELFLNQESTPWPIADHFRRGQLIELSRDLLAFGIAEKRSVFELFWSAAIRPILPVWISRHSYDRIPSWINRDFVRSSNLEARVRMFGREEARLRIPSQRRRCGVLMRTVGTLSAGYGGHHTTLGLLEDRYPFLHRPLVEYVLSLPVDQIMRPREHRSIQRRALCGILPESIRTRMSKRGPADAVLMGLAQSWPSLKKMASNSLACARGFVNQPIILNELDRVRHGACADLPGIMRFIALEQWLCAVERWEISQSPAGSPVTFV